MVFHPVWVAAQVNKYSFTVEIDHVDWLINLCILFQTSKQRKISFINTLDFKTLILYD